MNHATGITGRSDLAAVFVRSGAELASVAAELIGMEIRLDDTSATDQQNTGFTGNTSARSHESQVLHSNILIFRYGFASAVKCCSRCRSRIRKSPFMHGMSPKVNSLQVSKLQSRGRIWGREFAVLFPTMFSASESMSTSWLIASRG